MSPEGPVFSEPLSQNLRFDLKGPKFSTDGFCRCTYMQIIANM